VCVKNDLYTGVESTSWGQGRSPLGHVVEAFVATVRMSPHMPHTPAASGTCTREGMLVPRRV
jgi:hypothetical protein